MADAIAELSGLDTAVLIALLLAGLSILATTVWTGVPPMPTNRAVKETMLAMLPPDAAPRVIYDLGSGWGTLAVALADQYPDARVIGIELSPLPYAFSRLRQWIRPRPNLSLRWGDFLKRDLSEADLLVCYLMLQVMDRLQDKLDRDLAPGTIVLSNAFAFRGWKAEEIRVVETAMSAWVYRYRIGVAGDESLSVVRPTGF